jgi:methylated-DNA-[protein]-cysteine S-methyltransferase
MPGTKTVRAFYASPIGLIRIVAAENGILSLDFTDGRGAPDAPADPFLTQAVEEIDAYFRGGLKTFSVRLDLRGTPFQKNVWGELLKIPYGGTETYGFLARALGNARATRAVGGANHRNPVSIIVPCHRVVGADGSLTGYGGGLWRKKWLLAHEMDNR